MNKSGSLVVKHRRLLEKIAKCAVYLKSNAVEIKHSSFKRRAVYLLCQ